MRCSGGHICSFGICLGGNPNARPGEGGGTPGEGGAKPTSALWWIEDGADSSSTLYRYLPEPSLQTPFSLSSPLVFWDVSPDGKRWAAMLATSETRYEVVHTAHNTTRSLQTGSGVPQKISFAKDSRGLAFLLENESNQGLLFWSVRANESPQRLSLEKCGLADSSVHVLDFAWSPDSSALAVRALLRGGDMRAGIWVVATAEPSACLEALHPGEAMGHTPEWGALGPLHWVGGTLYFVASLEYLFPLQLYSFGWSSLGGTRNPLLSSSSHSLLGFAAYAPSWLALLQEGPALSLLSLRPSSVPLPVGGCETSGLSKATAMLFSPANDWLLLLGNGRLQLVSLAEPKCSQNFEPTVLEALWSPDGKRLAKVRLAENAAAWSLVLWENNGKNLLNPHVVSVGPQRLRQLRWTAYSEDI